MISLTREGIPFAQNVLVNGAPGLLVVDSHGVKGVVSLTVDRGLIVAIDTMRNPEKLRHVVTDVEGDR